MQILIISSSLNPESHSRVMAQEIRKILSGETGFTTVFLDLRDHILPLCDGDAAYGHPDIPMLKTEIKKAHVILIAAPIYNYDVGAAVKNLLELTGSAWEDKIVGFLCAAGGHSSYMSVMSFANSLMLDFRCVIIPRFVYAADGDFCGAEGQIRIENPKTKERLHSLASDAKRFLQLK